MSEPSFASVEKHLISFSDQEREELNIVNSDDIQQANRKNLDRNLSIL